MNPHTATSSDVQRKTDQTWTTRGLLTWLTGHFESRNIDSARVVAEMLLAHVLGCDRMRLYMEVERVATAEELATLRSLAARAANHEPVQYLLGEVSFYWRPFAVDHSTLIPQPSTETLVDFILQQYGRTGKPFEEPVDGMPVDTSDEPANDEPANPPAKDIGPPLRLADIGTGTGCIAVTLAAQLPNANVIAVDIVPGAIELARANAERYRVADRVEFREGSLLEPLNGEAPFDAICSNPPYVPRSERDQMDECVREHVPESAWCGGSDGLDLIRPLLADAPDLLAAGGWLAVEIADSQRDAVLAIATADARLCDVDVLKDHEGYWRTLVARRRG